MGLVCHLSNLIEMIPKLKKSGKKIVHCHGTFDLLHPGHVKHLQEAKNQGDVLVATVTAAKFVSKGPGRPVYSDQLRLDFLAALNCVDYVALHEAADAEQLILDLCPDIYVKGQEYRDFSSDVTAKIENEVKSVKSVGGEIYFTEDPTIFSSSHLLNHYFNAIPENTLKYLKKLKEKYCKQDFYDALDSLKGAKVMVVGDYIIDHYQYVETLGQSAKGIHMSAKCLEEEFYLGGAMVVANQLASFGAEVTLVSGVGEEDRFANELLQAKLDPSIKCQIHPYKNEKTLTKKRYVMKDGATLYKLFETYSGHLTPTTRLETAPLLEQISDSMKDFDLVLMCDYGNGFTNESFYEFFPRKAKFFALNTQTNSGNRGHNVVGHYLRADYISLNTPELRLATHNNIDPLETLAPKIMQKMQCPRMTCTQGTAGAILFEQDQETITIPPMTLTSVDRVGAGDSYFSLSSLLLARQYPLEMAGFLGSVLAALNINIVANKTTVKMGELKKFLSTILN